MDLEWYCIPDDRSSRTERTRAKVSAGWSGKEIVLVGGAQRTDRLMIANVRSKILVRVCRELCKLWWQACIEFGCEQIK